ncbi:MAG: hypothetical protein R2854_29725 [Caldilineaceae bacterium]
MLSSDTPTTAVPAEAPVVQSTARGWQSRRTPASCRRVDKSRCCWSAAVVMVIPSCGWSPPSFKAAGKTFVYPPSGS